MQPPNVEHITDFKSFLNAFKERKNFSFEDHQLKLRNDAKYKNLCEKRKGFFKIT